MRRLHESGYATSAAEEVLDDEITRRLEEAGLDTDPASDDYDEMRQVVEGEDTTL